MKTAISLPDPVFKEAEQYAKRTGRSRSQLYVEALEEYLARHQADAITTAMNEVMAELASAPKNASDKAEAAFLRASAKRTATREVW